ncbi:DUF4214 domain-containing protein [Verticiella sediminum]|uniref:DUF4214 domain-containing protein n=1 Tax=Verticiella sediminum TaxID=1247510 RepID=A0A556AKP8_9BURK|nr:DUF4214 domain-containing protein [Verticiella sediminum]TSH93453.1 DUF4214 domain-containing protein [Verticiella sediminum]
MATIGIEEAREEVAGLFLAYMGRAPEYQAMSYYVGRLQTLAAEQGDGDDALDHAYLALSAEIYVSAQANGEIPSEVNSTNNEYVTWIYENVLGRAPDEEGLEYWVTQLDNGTFGREDLLAVIIRSVQDQDPGSRDAMFFSNRLEVALEFAKFENSNPHILPTLGTNAAQILAGVNEDPASVDAALELLYSATGGGQSFNLTIGVDNLVGTSGDDTFTALPVNASNSQPATTLGRFDSIDGGAGRDTLNIVTDEDGNNAVQQGSVKNIEVVNIYNNGSIFANTDGVVDASKFVGVEEIWQHNDATIVANVGDDVTVGFRDIEKVLGGEEFGIAVAGVLTAENTTATTIAFDNFGTTLDTGEDGPDIGLRVGVAIAAGESLNEVNLTGSLGGAEGEAAWLVFGAVTGSETETFTLNTEIDTVLLAALGENVTTIDASGSTGDLIYIHGLLDALDALGEDGSVTDQLAGALGAMLGDYMDTPSDLGDYRPAFIGGAGDDIIIAADVRLTDSIDGGEGDNSLVLLTQEEEFQTENYDALDGLQNIQNLALLVTAEDFTLDATRLTGFEGLAISSLSGSFVEVQGLAADQALVLANPIALLEDASGVLGLEALLNFPSYMELQLTDAAADVTLGIDGSIYVNAWAGEEDDETETYTGVGATGGTLTVVGGVAVPATEDGQAPSVFQYSNDSSKFSTIDVSDYQGYFDLFDMSATVAETVTLGEGSEDSIFIVVGDGEETLSSSTFGLMDVIEDFDAAEDDLYVDTELDFSLFTFTGTPGSLNAAFSAAAAADASSTGIVLFQFDGDTYLYHNSTGGGYDTDDFAIKLVGLFSLDDLDLAAPV